MVNQTFKKLVLLVAVTCYFNHNVSEANQNKINSEPVFYFGIQGDIRQINLKENFGRPLFRDNCPQTGLFLGTLFNEYVGSELSYQTTIPKKHQRIVNEGQFVPGARTPLDRGEFEIYEVKQRLESIDLGLIGYLPPFCDNSFFGSVGIAFSKITARMKFSGDDLASIPNENDINLLSKTFQQKKIIPFIKIGIQHKMDNHFDMRFFIDWRNLAQFKILAPQPNQWLNTTQLKYKNSVGYGISLSYRW